MQDEEAGPPGVVAWGGGAPSVRGGRGAAGSTAASCGAPARAPLLLLVRLFALPLLLPLSFASPAGVILCVAPLAAPALWVAWPALTVVLAARSWRP